MPAGNLKKNDAFADFAAFRDVTRGTDTSPRLVEASNLLHGDNLSSTSSQVGS